MHCNQADVRICQRSNRLLRGGIGVAATQTTLYIQYNKDHAYTPVRTQKGQRSQTVSTALSVAIITRQPYIMKAFSIAAPIYDIRSMGGVKLNIRFTIIPF